jgi:hypothetical protein
MTEGAHTSGDRVRHRVSGTTGSVRSITGRPTGLMGRGPWYVVDWDAGSAGISEHKDVERVGDTREWKA